MIGKNTILDADELSLADHEIAKTAKRRAVEYSAKALFAAAKVDNIFIAHPDFMKALDALDRIFRLAPEFKVPYGAIVVGPTGVGKTALLEYFKKSLPNSDSFEHEMGAVTIRMQQRPSLGRTISLLLRELKYPFSSVTHQTVGIKRNIVLDSLRQKGTRMLLVDEAHRIGAGLPKSDGKRGGGQGTDLSEFIREIMDVGQIGMILAGGGELDGLRQIDKYLGSRISTRVALSDFSADKLWYGFLKAFVQYECGVCLKYLIQELLPNKLHAATRGNIRAFKQLAIEAVLVAVDSGKSALDEVVLREAYHRVYGPGSLLTNPF